MAGNQQIALSWVYPNLQKQSGNNTLSKGIVIAVGIVLFLICVFIIVETGFTSVTPLVLIGIFIFRLIREVNK